MDTLGHHESSERERSRIDALQRYRILDTPPDGAFDRVTALVANLLDVPISIVSLVDTDRIWFKSSHGLDVEDTGRDPGLCASAVLQDVPYVVEDAVVDPRALTNPLVAGEFGLRFYAGVPLRTRDGHNLGMLAAIDVEPRTLSPRELRILQDLAAVVMDEMELRLSARAVDDLNAALKQAHDELRSAHSELEARASRDGLTGLANHDTLFDVLDTLCARSVREGCPLAVMIVDIDEFKQINDSVGHLAGDVVLREIAERLLRASRASDTVGRFGGDEFLIVMYPCDTANAHEAAERIRTTVCSERIDLSAEGGESCRIGLSAGVFVGTATSPPDPQTFLRQSDAALYRAKADGSGRTVVSEAATTDTAE
ncbi:MAG: sensor domain-containing diguanylate cyclase [Trueperaceae bacterium]|nr:sensor domain-containing diguanylate cyclase [Trueperaceae bacterium]